MSLLVAIYFYLQIAWYSVESCQYEPTGTYFVMQPPYDFITWMGSVIYLDPVGSYHVVKKGVAIYYSKKSGKLEYARHLHCDRYKYIPVECLLPMEEKYNFITNNCRIFKHLYHDK